MAAPRSVCPRCRRTYASEVTLCKADGTPLVEEGPAHAVDERRGATLPPAPRATPSSASVPPPPGIGPRASATPSGVVSRHASPTRATPLGGSPVRGSTIPPTAPPDGARAAVERLGPYRLLRQLGEGGMARIYLAEHEKLGRMCAIKRLHADHFADRLTVARFLAEARAVGAIHHANLVAAYDVVEEPNEICLVMEYLDGRDVAHVLRDEGPMSPERAAGLMAQACDGLAAVHAHQIIHRDLKPENIFLTRLPEGGERVKLLDFGVARLLGDRPQELKTRSGLTVGTPTYMSPEQATASEIDARSDIYAVGVVLYEMLTGAPPFTGAGYGDVMLMHVNDPPPPLSSRRADAPRWIEDVVMRCLEKEPSARFQTAAELSAALRAGAGRSASSTRETRRMTKVVAPLALQQPAPRARMAWLAAAGFGVMGVAAVTVFYALRPARTGGGAVATAGPLATAAQPARSAAEAGAGARTMRISSTPPGAVVVVAGAERGRTPCEVTLPPGEGRVVVTAKADGYLAEQRIVDGASPPAELRFALKAEAPAPAPAPAAMPVAAAVPPTPASTPTHGAAHRVRAPHVRAPHVRRHGPAARGHAAGAKGATVDPFQ